MSSAVDQLPQQPGDPEGSRRRSTSDADVSPEPTDEVEAVAGFDDEFADEIRDLFASPKGKGLFGVGTVAAAAGATVEIAAETDAADAPKLFAAPAVSVPAVKKVEDAPNIGIFLPRVEATPERAAPALTGLSLAAENDAAPAAAPNLFVSSEVAPAEVAFVPAEELERNRYRWLLILLGLLFVGGAIWLTWMASTRDTVDAPVTTVANVSTTAVATTEAPASTTVSTTAVSTTAAPATTASTTESTVASTAPTTAAPQVQPTTPPRPATTARRPVTTARPATAPPTTAAPTTAATVPDVTFAPPTWSPNTTAGAAEPPAGPAEPPAEPAATAPAEPAVEG